jgi:acyl dehydratase
MIPPEQLLALPPLETTADYGVRDTILYALGLGLGRTDPGASRALRFLYEPDLQALPSLPAVLARPGFYLREPSYGIDWRRVLHGEQRLTLHRPVPVQGQVHSSLRFSAVHDKGAAMGAILVTTRELREAATGALLATLGSTSFLRGDGGCGSVGPAAPRPHVLPGRAPDLQLTCPTYADQPLIYRLSGDTNPLHVDPTVATAAGFAQPILHGLCSYGMVAHQLMEVLCDGDPAAVRQLDVRFSSPVYPGETLLIDVWRETVGQAGFRVRLAERPVTVLDHGLFRSNIGGDTTAHQPGS